MNLKDLWNDDFYKEIINGCPCNKCVILRVKIEQSYDTLTQEEKDYFEELVKETYDRLIWEV